MGMNPKLKEILVNQEAAAVNKLGLFRIRTRDYAGIGLVRSFLTRYVMMHNLTTVLMK